jgi:hypothetical protein
MKCFAMWGPPTRWRTVTLLRTEPGCAVIRYESGAEKGIETSCSRDTLVSVDYLRMLIRQSDDEVDAERLKQRADARGEARIG